MRIPSLDTVQRKSQLRAGGEKVFGIVEQQQGLS
jgi:hypothetical protein